MGWDEKKKIEKMPQQQLFIELTEEERIITAILNGKEAVSIDEINFRCNLSTSEVAAALLQLELQNVVTALPGKLYKLLADSF
jgi:DNA processing protein